MLSMYDPRRAEIVSEIMAFKATLEPRLTRLMKTPKINETTMALSGIGR